MTLIKAIDPGRLVPLRSPWNAAGSHSSLLAHHRANHPNEIKVHPEMPIDQYRGESLYHLFFGVKVVPSQAMLAQRSFNGYVLDMTRSEIAALLLEQTFSQVSWDQANDRTIAQANDGRLFSNQGTNLVESGILLPLLKSLAEMHAPKIEEGIGWVEAVFDQGELHQAQAASPLQVKIAVPGLGDPEHFDRWSYERTVTQSFLQAIKPFLPA